MILNHNIQQVMLCNRDRFIGFERSKSSEKLSSGVVMNRASDNCSGLAIYQGIHKHALALEKASRNTQDGISLLQSMDGDMQDIEDNIKRMKQLAVQSTNATLTDSDREKVQTEMKQLKQQINFTANNSSFNGINVLNQDSSLDIQISDEPYVTFNAKTYNCTTKALGIDSVDVSTTAGGNDALKLLDNATDKILENLSQLGSDSNALEHIYTNTANLIENINATEANIHDTNMAYESMNMVRLNILQESTDALFAQSGNMSKNSLELLKS